MMLGEESQSAHYWKQCGDEALANGIKGVVIMVRYQLFSVATGVPSWVALPVRASLSDSMIN